MAMSKRLLSPDAETQERQRTEQAHVMTLEEAIQEYIRIDLRYQELAEEKKRCLEVLLSEAVEVRGQTNTARLDNHDGSKQIKVQFGVDYKCDVDGLNEVKEMIGDDKFDELFKTDYTARLKALKPFLSTKSTDELIETAKEKIKQVVTTVPKSPYLTIEKGRGSLGSDDVPW